jgi:hypothetical protein
MSETLEGALAGALEEALIDVYERDREMFDADAVAAIDALVSLWHPGQETVGPEDLSHWAYAAYEAMRDVCEAYSGRDIPFDVDDVALFPHAFEDDTMREVMSAEQVISVLLQLRQSIEYWQEHAGFRGFYESIRE